MVRDPVKLAVKISHLSCRVCNWKNVSMGWIIANSIWGHLSTLVEWFSPFGAQIGYLLISSQELLGRNNNNNEISKIRHMLLIYRVCQNAQTVGKAREVTLNPSYIMRDTSQAVLKNVPTDTFKLRENFRLQADFISSVVNETLSRLFFFFSYSPETLQLWV